MLDITRLKHIKRIYLSHYGKCYLLGIDKDGTIYAEDYYDESYIAQYCLTKDGEIIQTVDENFGKSEIIPLTLPTDIVIPQQPLNHPLNYTGMRYHGLRDAEKVSDWVQPLSVMEKMPLLKALHLTVSPMMIFGIAESRVLSETQITNTETIVCRQIRLLRALPEIEYDKSGLPYDYDTIRFHVIHAFNSESETYPPLHEALQHFPEMKYPSDCIYSDSKLIVSNSSDGDNPSEIHIYKQDESGKT